MADRDRQAVSSPPRAPLIPGAEAAPSFVLVGEHFAAALAWLFAGSVGLIVVAPLLAAGGYLVPHVIAVTHCFTLGWITTSIFGALYQIYPVALGVPAKSERVGHATFAALQLGTLTLVAGTWWWRPVLLAAAWVLLLAAVGGMSWNLLPARRRATRGRRLGAYVTAGHSALGLAMFVVFARIGMELGWWRVDRMAVIAAHAHLAVVGFATLTIVGVGGRLLPMFLLSHHAEEWKGRWIGPLLGGGVLVYAAARLARLHTGELAGAALMTIGVLVYLALVAHYVHRRTRRALDPGLSLVLVALGCLFLATLFGDALAWRHTPSLRLDAAYAVLGILGWVTLFAVGIYHKIVPFLTWLHRFSARVGEPDVPRVADLLHLPLAWTCGGLLAAGTLGLTGMVATGRGAGARWAAVVIALGSAAACLQFARVAVGHPRRAA